MEVRPEDDFDTSQLAAELAADVEALDDDDDWDDEGVNKRSVVAQLRSLPLPVNRTVAENFLRFHFSCDEAAADGRVVDIAVGITARLERDDTIAALIFELTVSNAARRLEAFKLPGKNNLPVAENVLETPKQQTSSSTNLCHATTTDCSPTLAPNGIVKEKQLRAFDSVIKAGTERCLGRQHVSRLVAKLVSDVVARDDDNDWEEEGLNKKEVVEQLQALPEWADYSDDKDTSFLRFLGSDESAECGTSESIDISVGVMADRVPGGRIIALRFALDCPAALQRLDAITCQGQEPSQL